MRKKKQPRIINKQAKKQASVSANAASSSLHVSESYSGPLPPAKEMERFYALDPELVHRIVTMAEAEAQNRHTVEQETLKANTKLREQQFAERRLGQYFGFSIGLSGLVTSLLLAFMGASDAASIVGGSTVIGLVGIFVTGQWLSKKNVK